MNWPAVVFLAIAGLTLGILLAQLVGFRRRAGIVVFTADERPVTRRFVVLALIVVTVGVARLMYLDLDTRDCIEETRAAIIAARTAEEVSPLTEEC